MNPPASTMPSTFSTVVLGNLVSLSLTVTVTSLQLIFLMVVFLRCASETACCSTSTLEASFVSKGVRSMSVVSEGVLGAMMMKSKDGRSMLLQSDVSKFKV